MSAENKSQKFDRTLILNRYWQLANLTPEETKGNITGQLKALEALIALLPARAEAAKPVEKRPQEVEIYRSSWMN